MYRMLASALIRSRGQAKKPAFAMPDSYPSGPVKLVIPFLPGGGPDLIGRIVAKELGRQLGRPVLVFHAPGAGGTVALNRVARALPDGYTLLMANASTLAMTPNTGLFDSAPPRTKFLPVAPLCSFSNVLVAAPCLPATTLKEFIAYARKNPAKLSFASPGVGTTSHLLSVQLGRDADIEMTHVACRGSAPALANLMKGKVDVMFDQPASLLSLLRSGRLKALATADERRHASLPDIATVGDLGMPLLALRSWTGIVAPIDTPGNVVTLLEREIRAMLALPAFRAVLIRHGVDPLQMSRAEFDRTIRAGHAWQAPQPPA